MNPARRHTTNDHEAPNRERFLQLLNGCLKRLEDFAYAMTRNPDDAGDLVAETVLRAYEAFPTLRDRQAFVSFVFTIATREHRRRTRRARLFAAYEPERAERIRFAGTMPDVAADVRALYEAINTLPTKQREAVVLFEISGFTLAEVQAVQGGTLSGVKVRLHRARRRLAELLGVSAEGEPDIATPIGRSHPRRGSQHSQDTAAFVDAVFPERP